jgi:hypothetical protein
VTLSSSLRQRPSPRTLRARPVAAREPARVKIHKMVF